MARWLQETSRTIMTISVSDNPQDSNNLPQDCSGGDCCGGGGGGDDSNNSSSSNGGLHHSLLLSNGASENHEDADDVYNKYSKPAAYSYHHNVSIWSWLKANCCGRLHRCWLCLCNRTATAAAKATTRQHFRWDFSTISFTCIGLVLVILTTHRILSVYMTHRKWINAPITYMERTCPAPTYPTLLQQQQLQQLDGSPKLAAAAQPERLLVPKTTGNTNNQSHNDNVKMGPTNKSVQLPDASKICITTLTDAKTQSRLRRFLRWRNFDGILELTWKNKQSYAAKHGYRIYDGSHLLDTSRPPAWTKIRAIQDLLQKTRTTTQPNKKNEPAQPSASSVGSPAPPPDGGEQEPLCEWVMWTDADTIIMNSEIRMESFLPAAGTVGGDFLVGSDNGGGHNSGVLIFKNTAWSRQFLEQWWNMKDFVRPPGFSLSGDNASLKALLRDMDPAEFAQHVYVPARCTINSFAKFLTLSDARKTMSTLQEQEWYLSENYYHAGDFIAHTPGYDNKAETLALLLKEAK